MGGWNPIKGKIVPCIDDGFSTWGGLGCCNLYIGLITWGIIDLVLNIIYAANDYYWGVLGILLDILVIIIGIEAIKMEGKVRAILCRVANMVYCVIIILAIIGLIDNIIWISKYDHVAHHVPAEWWFNTIVSFLWVMFSAYFFMGSCESLAVQVHG